MNNKNKLSKFNNVFEDMIFTRLEYKDIYKMIEKLLPTEHRKLVQKYEETRTEEFALLENIIYKQGLKDGVELREIISN